ncbi:MAG: EcsC family protein [Planctomycetia bacterium]|nr:EcsC family protein [Planctomycetia bacterium]
MRKPNAYILSQIHQIAGWKAEAPSMFRSAWEVIEHPLVVAASRFIPEESIRAELKLAYQMSEIFTERDEVLRIAGIRKIDGLRDGSLRRCDRLAEFFLPRVAAGAYERSAAMGVTGGNSIITSVPITLMFALRAVHTIGFCYGFDGESLLERAYALGILRIASARDLDDKQRAIASLRDAEDEVLSEAIEEFMATLIQEAIGKTAGEKSIPFVGAAFGAALDGAYAERVARIAIRTFQERWMRINDYVDTIPPDPRYARNSLQLFQGSVSYLLYWTNFTISFFTSFPFLFAGSFVPRGGPVGMGIVAGKNDAVADVNTIRYGVRNFLFPRSVETDEQM